MKLLLPVYFRAFSNLIVDHYRCGREYITRRFITGV